MLKKKKKKVGVAGVDPPGCSGVVSLGRARVVGLRSWWA